MPKNKEVATSEENDQQDEVMADSIEEETSNTSRKSDQSRNSDELMKISKGLIDLSNKTNNSANEQLLKYIQENKLVDSLKEIKSIMTQYLLKSNFDHLYQFMKAYFQSCRPNVISESVFNTDVNSTSSDKSESTNQFKLSRERAFMLKLLTCWMFEGRLEGRVAKNGLGIIFEELDYLPDAMLVSLIQAIYTLFKDGGQASDVVSPLFGNNSNFDSMENNAGLVLDIWTQCISAVMAKDEIEINSKTKKKKKSEEYKTGIIKDMCKCDWSQKVLAFANAFKDMPLNDNELELVVDKFFKYLNKMNLNDCAPLIYQLLILSSRGKRQKILLGIIAYFDNLEKEKRRNSLTSTEDSVNQLEGTVLHFIDYATKQNQELATEMLKIMKNESSGGLNTFKASFLLIISGLMNFEEKAFKVLKTFVDDDYKNSTKIHLYLSEEEDQLLSFRYKSSNVILDTVKKCGRGRDFMIKSVVDFACYLLDAKKVKASSDDNFVLTKVAMHSHDLGLEILGKMFELSQFVRSDILSRIFNRVVTNYGNTEKYIDLLRNISKNQTNCLLDHISKLKETIEYLSTMPTDISNALLTAVQPLYKNSQEFQDQVVLVLRKSMYSRELDSRLVALNGFLQILLASGELEESNVGSSSASSSSSSIAQHRASTIDLEIIGFLRRCLGQQMIVRKTLYGGLCDLVTKKPELRKEITPIMIDHLKKYMSMEDEDKPEVFFDSCIGTKTMTIAEPLPSLFYYLVHVADDERDKDAYNMLIGIMNYLFSKSLSELSIDKPFDDTNEGKKNRLVATIYAGCIEALFEFTLLILSKDEDNGSQAMEVLNTFWANYSKVIENLNKKPASTSKKKTSTTEKFDPTSFLPELSIQFCTSAISAASESVKDVEVSENAIADSKFHAYLLKLIAKKTKAAKKINQKLPDDGLLGIVKGLYIFLVRLTNKGSSASTDDPKKKDKTTTQTSEVFEELIRMKTQNSSPAEIIDFYEGFIRLSKSQTSSNNDSRISDIMQTLQKNISSILKQKSFETATSFVRILTSLVHFIEGKCEILENSGHYSWIIDICKGNEFGHNDLGHALINHLVTLACIFMDVPKLQELASDVLGKVGHIEDAGERTVTNMLAINCPSETADVLISRIGLILDDLDWKYQRLETLKDTLSDNYEDTKKNIFHQTTLFIDTLEHLICAKLEMEISEKLFSPLIKFYTMLAKFTDTYLSLPKDSGIELCEEYCELVDRSGDFTTTCYSFINYHNEEEKSTSMKIVREARNIPELIFRMETSEQKLILLSKHIKQNLLKNYKRSQVRAFTIDNQKVMEAAEEKKKRKKKDDEEEEQIKEESENEQEEEEKSSKKKKKASKKRKSPTSEKSTTKKKKK
ncbi:hypothetical protein NAEGRDRAFT_57172 [Naegleria gruberi]|uniref:Uncharacterized protein n=1 Tax=Naegleria gruberi TaxID=5762 RepID=D2V546_NAEGR|nr:uncharacterized protein NAEGRDRAFT_57172 [Naegleria gruberi]EFC48047.1 hypothetical protein NAEGRDRAFT_57172 [Naegleria gruberi]|eukprot:XP_002680791.1 hypothetical protein NAEGRDRAFT_57172 [Naegleria gruberi strain NEG-M]